MMSNKYTFTQEYTDEYGQTSKVEHTFYADTHDEIAERFNEFLRGCGFYFEQFESYQLVGDQTEAVWTTTDLGEQVLDEFDRDPGLDQRLWEESVANVPSHNYPNGVWPFAPTVKCVKCGMTREAMGTNRCYEASGCGLGLDGTL